MKDNLTKFYVYAVSIIVLFVVIISIIGNNTNDKQDEQSDKTTTQTYSETHSQTPASDANTSNFDTDASDDESSFEEDDIDDSDFEEYEEPKSTKLFKKIYVPYATRENTSVFSAVSSYVKASGFKSKIVKPSKKEPGEITVHAKNGDSVFFSFYECNGLDMIMSVSYYSEKNNREVSRSNYSDNNDAEYDKLSTHVIGDSKEEVDSVDEQCSFLFEN